MTKFDLIVIFYDILVECSCFFSSVNFHLLVRLKLSYIYACSEIVWPFIILIFFNELDKEWLIDLTSKFERKNIMQFLFQRPRHDSSLFLNSENILLELSNFDVSSIDFRHIKLHIDGFLG